ncbi:uncharacterized protein LOC132192444 [Neocloeon triangulifer]|uniref:uncharacterized protein LOC132192444 n=1 Tax=Neocloeon triangulifer TaxID=2078957 RepID=UPI00286F9C44|nr:uncharacterized protein LOC132192444 [Neocloeon triangulifer]
MADKGGSNDEENPNLRRRRDSEEEDGAYDDGASSSSGTRRPDIGLGHAQKRRGRGSRDDSTPEMPRREDSGSLSFKHFLQSPSTSTGTRPKVYDNPRHSYDQNSPPFRRPPGASAELTSALPDFVQDHLVMEQCYLQNNIDIDNLPDFAAMDLGQRGGLPFDLTARNGGEPSQNNGSLPLDLAPSAADRPARGPNDNVPCDLGLGNSLVQQSPLDLRGGEMNLQDNSVNQSLPDFLSDAPILTGRETDGGPVAMIEDNERNGMTDNERILRRQLTEATRRADQLEMELQRQQEVIRHKEEVLRRTNSELAALRRENSSLRQGIGGGHPDHRTQRLAQSLVAAASNAESSLRTLLQGVEDLRILATAIDQGTSGQPHSPPRQSPHHDFDPEDRAGPAL